MTEITCVLDARAALGENPHWSVEERALYWLDASLRAVHRFDPVSGENRTWTLPEVVGSFALREQGGLIVAMGAGLYLVNLEPMRIETLAGPLGDPARTRLNDGKCDPAGRFWVGSMDLEKHRPIAALYRVERDHRVETVVTGLIVSNGLAWSPDGTVLYHSDSRQNTIWRYAFAPATGQATERRVFATVDPEREGRPDGAAVDAEGCYWSAGVGAGRLTRYAPDGCVDRIIQLPVRFPSMCAFGGPELDVLYLTSAREFLSPAELEEEPLAGGLFALRPGVKGLAVPRYGG